MKFLMKLFEIFRKTKELADTTKHKIEKFVDAHKKQIKLMITVYEAMFPQNTGLKKMACLVSNVCYAMGLDNVSQDVAEFVEKQCQKVYDDFKASLN